MEPKKNKQMDMFLAGFLMNTAFMIVVILILFIVKIKNGG